MKQYKYTAVNLNKEKFTGIFIAKDEKDLAAQLSKQNLFLVSCSPYSAGTPSAFFTLGTGKVSTGELTSFCRQFSIMINSGISVLESIDMLKDQAYSTYFKSLLRVIFEDVKSGVMVSDALNKHNSVFPEFFRSMIYVGEVSGKLDVVLSALADYYENDASVKRKLKSAFSYPIMLLGMTVGIVILMLVFVIPTFRGALTDMDVQLTGFTAGVYAVSDFMVHYWLYVLAGLVVIIGSVFIFCKTKVGSFYYDKFLLHCPIIKNVQIDMIASRFARAFSLMISSGMDFVEALDAVTVVLGNKDVTQRFMKAADEVKHGSKMAVAFEKYKLFPQILLQMIAVGERTAALDDILSRSCKFFDEQVEISLNSLTAKIQPILLVFMGGIIGVLFIAVYSPMISIMTNIM